MSEGEGEIQPNPVPIEELMRMFAKHLENPNPQDQIASWNVESTHVQEMTEFLKLEESPQVVVIAAVSYLLHYVPIMFQSFDPGQRFEYVNALYEFFAQNPARFADGKVCDIFSDLFSGAIISVYGQIEEIEGLIGSFFEVDPSSPEPFIIAVTVLTHLCIYAKQKRLFQFLSQYGTQIVIFSATNMQKLSEIDEGLANFLAGKLSGLMYEEMSFELHSFDDSQKFSQTMFSFSEDTGKVVATPEFISTIFNLIPICGENGYSLRNTYNVLYFLSSLDEKNFIQIQLESEGEGAEEREVDTMIDMRRKKERENIQRDYIVNFFSTFLEYVKQCTPNDFALESLTRLLVKVKMTQDVFFTIEQYDFGSLIDFATRLNDSIFQPEKFLSQLGSLHNVVKFWETCNRSCDERKGILFSKFIEIVIAGVLNDEEYRDAFLETKQTSIYEDIRELAKSNIEQVIQTLIDSLNEHVALFYDAAESEAPEGESAVIAFLIDFIVSFSQGIKKMDGELIDKVAELYNGVFDIFINALQMDPIEGFYIQKSLISFESKVMYISFLISPRSPFFNKLEQIKFVGDEKFASPEDIYSFIIRNIIYLFSGKFPDELLQSAASALHNLLKQQNVLNYAFNKGCAEQLITMREKNEFSFESGKTRKMLHTAIADILKTHIQSPLNAGAFIHQLYDKTFEGDPKETMNQIFEAMLDFSGYFSDLDNTSSFFFFFDYIFPEKLEYFTSIIPQIVQNPVIIISMIEFWRTMLSNKNIIVFRNHSPNGLRLFKIGQRFVRTVMETISESVKASGENENSSAFMTGMAKVFARLLDAPYVPYNAFTVFNDPDLLTLINDFFMLVQMYPVDREMQSPDLAESLIEAVKAICKNHLTISIGAGHGGLILCCIGSNLLMSSKNTNACIALNTLLENIEDLTTLSHDDFSRLVIIIWGHIYRNSSNTQLHNIIYKVYCMYPDCMGILHDRIMAFAVDEGALQEKFEIYMSEIESRDQTKFNNATAVFANSINTLIKTPYIAFS